MWKGIALTLKENRVKGFEFMSDHKETSSLRFKPLGDGWGIQPLGPSPLGGDMHETFKVDKEGNVSGGHTTVRIPGGQSIQLPWSK